MNISEIQSILGTIDLKSSKDMLVSKKYNVFIMIDISKSMALYKELLKDAIFHLYNSLREYKQEIELTLITFNNDIKILKPTQNIKEMQLFEQELNFCYEGASFIGSALQEMTCLVEERTVEYKNHVPRIRYSTIVFLLSDGNINCYNADIVRKENEALQLTQQYICENHIEVVSVGIGRLCNYNFLKELTGLNSDRHVKRVNSIVDLKDFVNQLEAESDMIITRNDFQSKKWHVQKNMHTICSLNMSKRIPIIFLIDTSKSMAGYEDFIKTSICKLYDSILDDRTVSNAVELSVLTFNNDIFVHEQLCEIKRQENRGRSIHIECTGISLIGLALNAAIQQLEERIKTYTQNIPKVRYYVPIIFIISHGMSEYPNDNIRKQEEEALVSAKAFIKKKVSENRLGVISGAIGNCCNLSLMRELTGIDTDNRLIKIDTEISLNKFLDYTKVIIHNWPQICHHHLDLDMFSSYVQ